MANSNGGVRETESRPSLSIWPEVLHGVHTGGKKKKPPKSTFDYQTSLHRYIGAALRGCDEDRDRITWQSRATNVYLRLTPEWKEQKKLIQNTS
jgi:hypothetical protein